MDDSSYTIQLGRPNTLISASGYYVLNAIGRSEGGVQSDFELSRPGNWTGLFNPIVYLVRFTPYNTIEKIIVK